MPTGKIFEAWRLCLPVNAVLISRQTYLPRNHTFFLWVNSIPSTDPLKSVLLTALDSSLNLRLNSKIDLSGKTLYKSLGSGGFPCGLVSEESACNVGDLGSIPGLGRSPGEGKGYPLQYSCLENSMGSQRVEHDWETFISFHFGSGRQGVLQISLFIGEDIVHLRNTPWLPVLSSKRDANSNICIGIYPPCSPRKLVTCIAHKHRKIPRSHFKNTFCCS